MLARLQRPLVVYQQRATMNNEATIGTSYVKQPLVVMAKVGSVKPGQTITFGQVEHSVDRCVTTRGPRYAGARPGDALVTSDSEVLYVLAIEDPAQQKKTIYWCQERRDLRLT